MSEPTKQLNAPNSVEAEKRKNASDKKLNEYAKRKILKEHKNAILKKQAPK